MNKQKSLILILLIAVILSCMTFICYATGVTVTGSSFARCIDGNGNETDNILMNLELTVPANSTQLAISVLGEDVDDVYAAYLEGKLIYINQCDVPSDRKLSVKLDKTAILAATGASQLEGTTIYVRMATDTVGASKNEEIVITLSEAVVTGDLDGDDEITDSDAIYLMYNTFFADTYPLNQDCDFNGDGEVTDSDAIYLMYHTFFPDEYPLLN